MKPPSLAVPYSFIYKIIAEKARELGYAVALHGSMQTDIDLIAVPWTNDCEVTPYELAQIIAYTCRVASGEDGWWFEAKDGSGKPLREPELKPHGRLSWAIPLGAGLVVDLSVMPMVKEKE